MHQVLLDPAGRRFVHQMLRLEDRHVHLVAHLQGVAPVDEDRGLVFQHDGHARGPAEAGEPFQALGVRRHIFALVLVGTGNDEAVEPPARHFRAQPGHARGAHGGVRIVGEDLKTECFVHAPYLGAMGWIAKPVSAPAAGSSIRRWGSAERRRNPGRDRWPPRRGTGGAAGPTGSLGCRSPARRRG